MEFKQAQQHIHALYTLKARCDANSTTLANTLQKDISTGFSGQQKYIYELLQNADDSAAPGRMLEVNFTYVKSATKESGGYLIFSHTGKHFSYADVEKITDNAQQLYKDKSNDSHKIGYKGIGFKAIFSVADAVHVISGTYSFRFDKNYSQWQKTNSIKQAYPWPIIPIWTGEDEIPSEIKPLINKDKVNFIMCLKNNIDIKQEFDVILKNPAIVLFLHNLRILEFQNDLTLSRIELKEHPPLGGMEIQELCISCVNQPMRASYWLKWEKNINIPTELHNELIKMDDFACPHRLKEAQVTSITFAARLDAQSNIIPIKDACLYGYLPTQVRQSLVYFVNADFLLTPTRTELQVNKWNKSLLRWIGYYQFEWFAQLAAEKRFRSQILQLLVPPDGFYISTLAYQDVYKEGCRNGIKEIPFVPSFNENCLLLASEAVVDETGFYQAFPEQADGKKIVAYDLLNYQVLKKYSSLNLDLKKLCSQIIPQVALANKTFDMQLKLCAFFKNMVDSHRGNNLVRLSCLEVIRQTPFLLTADNKILKANEIYFDEAAELIPRALAINLLHPWLEGKTELKPWLLDLGIKQASVVDIIRGHIFNLIDSNKITVENVVSITCFIFKAFTVNLLSNQDYDHLKKLAILTGGGKLIPADQAYLADSYQPKLALESIIKTDCFVSPLYLHETGETCIKDWQLFFDKLGIADEVKIFIRPAYSVAQARIDKGNQIDRYISAHACIGKKTNKKIPDLIFRNFIDYSVIANLENPMLVQYFWQAVIAQWDTIKNSSTTLSDDYLSWSIDRNYIVYVASTIPIVPCYGRKDLYPSEKVFSAKFGPLINYLPVVCIKGLNSQQEEYFRFRNKLTIFEIEQLIETLNNDNVIDHKAYELLLNELCNYPRDVNQRLSNKLCDKNLQLPSQNGSLQLARNLHCFAIEGETIPNKSSTWLHKFPDLALDKLMKICELFDITVVTKDNINLRPLNAGPDEELLFELIYKLPYVARIEANEKGGEEKQILLAMCEKLRELNVYCAQQLPYFYKDIQILQVYAVCVDKQLYFKGNWKRAATMRAVSQCLSGYLQLSSSQAISLRDILELTTEEIDEFFDSKEISIDNLPQFTKEEKQNILLSPKTKNKEKRAQPTIDNQAANFSISTAAELSVESAHASTLLLQPLIPSCAQEPVISDEPFTDRSQLASPNSSMNSSVHVGPLLPQSSVDNDEASLTEYAQPTYVLVEPLISPSSVDIGKVSFRRAKLSPFIRQAAYGINSVNAISASSINPPPSAQPSETYELNYVEGNYAQSIGRLGEELVYNALNAYYRDKYPNYTHKEEDNGFSLFHEQKFLKIIWHNKRIEAGQACDFTIYKNGTERYIEVKSSSSNTQFEMRVSRKQYDMLCKTSDRYRFFKVYNCGKENPRIEKIKNPAQKLQAGELAIVSYSIK